MEAGLLSWQIGYGQAIDEVANLCAGLKRLALWVMGNHETWLGLEQQH